MAKILTGRKILIVEDDYLLAQVLADMLEEAGADIIGTVGWLAEALAIATDRQTQFDTAILDINLHEQETYAVADLLTERGVKVLFCTGYSTIRAEYQHYPRCIKPFRVQALLAALVKE
ncbi:response regulator [Dyella jejuensis]|uniref:Response regulator n=1 Tax=Dyella jejuensis TaxID=1432009 RepID=A0ABW8JEU0_9GAMM